MSYLEQAKKLLAESEEKQESLFQEIKEPYLEEGFDEDEIDIENGIVGDLVLEWYSSRDVDYMDDVVTCQKLLVRALEILEPGDKKAIHNGKKALETLVRQARRVKKDKNDDIKKAQEVIAAMDEIIKLCDANRK